jgi:hypothetical protein
MKPIILLIKAIDKRDTHTGSLFDERVETHTRKDGVVQRYHVSAVPQIVTVARINTIHDKRQLVDKRDMLRDFLSTKPESPNADSWRKQIAEIDAQISPHADPKKESAKKQTPDMSGWSEHQQAAYGLRKEYEDTFMYASPKELGEFKRKIRRVAKTIPESDERAVTQVDLLVTRVWGADFDPRRADVEFAKPANQSLPAPEGSHSAAVPPAPTYDAATMESMIAVAADSLAKLRKVDVFRVLESNSRNTQLARYIAANRQDLAIEVREVMEDEFGIKDWMTKSMRFRIIQRNP